MLPGTILSADRITPYIKAILDPEATHLPRLECPPLNTSRYEPLRSSGSATPQIEYFFALDLRQCLPLLPRLIGSIVEAIRFLGPHRCVLSIVEGNSPDGTGDVLSALGPFLEDDLGLAYFYTPSAIDPSSAAGGSRIDSLAQLRNLALQPLVDRRAHASASTTTILFVNDVAACAEDLLELALQRRALGADMACGMDWTYAGRDPTFYDVWVARRLDGDSFFEIPADGSWDSAWDLFRGDGGPTRARFDAHLPFQVFSCWNGAAAIGAGPVLGGEGGGGLRFRAPRAGECAQGEPQLFCKDLWSRGFGKIAVVPSVNLEYSDGRARDIKHLKGYTSDWARGQTEEGNRIDWVLEPPEKVRCMPSWDNQFWRPWNETLGVQLE